MVSKLFLVTLALALSNCKGGKVLFWQDTGSKSHMFALSPLALALADKGHEVVYVSKYRNKELMGHKSIEFIDLVGHKKEIDSKSIFRGDIDWDQLTIMAIEGQNASLSDGRVQELLSNPPHFDVVIVSFFSMNIGLYAAHNIFKAPSVIFSAGSAMPHIDLAMGNPVNPSYIPLALVDVGPHMGFKDRLKNTLALLFMTGFMKYSMMPRISVALQHRLNLDDTPDLLAEMDKVSGAMYNTHPILDAVKPQNPNTVLVGGLHIKEANLDNIDKELRQWMDNAEHGVVVVSFGSILSASELPASTLSAMLAVFSRLKQRVVWKWENDSMPNKPANLLINKWLPQSDILGHPKVRLFVTHGGLLGNEESIYHGIPMLVIPGFGDQFANAKRVTRLGLGLDLSWQTLTEKNFDEAINRVLSESSFKTTSVQYSKIFRDEPLKPLDKGVFFVEHIMRHGDIRHLRPSSLDLEWYKFYLVDVFLAITITPIILSYIVFKVFKRLCCSTSNKQADKHKKRQ